MNPIRKALLIALAISVGLCLVNYVVAGAPVVEQQVVVNRCAKAVTVPAARVETRVVAAPYRKVIHRRQVIRRRVEYVAAPAAVIVERQVVEVPVVEAPIIEERVVVKRRARRLRARRSKAVYCSGVEAPI